MVQKSASFLEDNAFTSAANAYDWARNTFDTTPAWKRLAEEPNDFNQSTFWLDSASHEDGVAHVFYDMTLNHPDTIYNMGIQQFKDAVKAARYDPLRTSRMHPRLPTVFSLTGNDIEQTRKDLISIANLLYAYQTYGSPGQQRAVQDVLAGLPLNEVMHQDLKHMYDLNKDKLFNFDFSNLHLPPGEIPRLLQDLESKKRDKTILNSATSKSDKNSTDSPPIPVDGYSTILQERLQQKRQKGSN